MRSRLPIFRTPPSRTVDTLSFLPMSPMSSFLPLNANEDVRDATRSPCTFDSALMISSAIPSAKYSFSASALMFANGSTATDFACDTVVFGKASVFVGVVSWPETSAWANSAEVANRPDPSVDIALVTAQSTLAGTDDRISCNGLGVSVNRFAMIDCGVFPLNGLSPEIISYSMQARLY